MNMKAKLRMDKQTSTKGGARKGAGRPKTGRQYHNVNVCLTEAQRTQFKALGGSSWLREQLDATKT